MPYKYIEGITRADVCIEATGKDLTELFQGAADGTIKVMAEPETVKAAITKEFEVENDDPKRLLFEFIEEIIVIKDSEGMVFNKIMVNVEGNKCKGKAIGDKVNYEEQELGQDVKAITMHYYTVEKTEKGWRAQFVLDI